MAFKLFDNTWKHLNVQRKFTNSDMYVYNTNINILLKKNINILLKKNNNEYRIRIYFNEEGSEEAVKEIFFEKILSTYITSENNLYEIKIEFINQLIIKTIKLNKLKYEDAQLINDFLYENT